MLYPVERVIPIYFFLLTRGHKISLTQRKIKIKIHVRLVDIITGQFIKLFCPSSWKGMIQSSDVLKGRSYVLSV